MADPNPEKQAKFSDDLKVGLGIGLLPMLLTSAFFGNDPNASAIAAGVSLAMWGCYSGRTITRDGWSAWRSVLAVTLGAWIVGAMMLSMAAQDVRRQYRAIDALETFAASDFERFTVGGDGKLTTAKLREIIAAQYKLKQAIKSSDEADKAIDAMPSFDAQKAISHVSVGLAKQTLQSQLLADASIDRAKVVADYSCVAVGQSKNTPSCSFTVTDLKQFRVRTEAQYAYWIASLRHFGWL